VPTDETPFRSSQPLFFPLADHGKDDLGMPRILTPSELHDFLSQADETALTPIAGPNLIAVDRESALDPAFS